MEVTVAVATPVAGIEAPEVTDPEPGTEVDSELVELLPEGPAGPVEV